MSRLTSTVADSLFSQLAPTLTDTVVIKSNEKVEGSWLLENALIKKFRQHGTEVQLTKSIPLNDHLKIEYKLLKLGVDYAPTSLKDIIERHFIVNVDIRALAGRTTSVKFIGNFNQQFADSILIADVEKVENDSYVFTKSTFPIRRGYKKYIEPFVVMTTTAGIIYLFFRLRSK